MSKPNKNKAEIKPVLKRTEVLLWTPEYLAEVFHFLDYFFTSEGVFKITKENVMLLQRLSIDNHIYFELLERVDAPWTEEMTKHNGRFQIRFSLMYQVIRQSIIKYPNILTPLVVKENIGKKQYVWLKEAYELSGEIKTPKTEMEKAVTILDSLQPPSAVDNPSNILLQAMGKVAEIYQKIAISITDKEIKNLDVKDRIAALQKLSYIHTTTKKFKPNMNFIKINTNNATAEKLEEALLDFNKDEEDVEQQ